MDYVSPRDIKVDTDKRFYCKPLLRRRDVAVGVLLDLSGSTAQAQAERPAPETASPLSPRRRWEPTLRKSGGASTVVEVETQAAFALSRGLALLEDPFGIFGFNGAGRQDCRFCLIKDFDEPWGPSVAQALLSVRPSAATRIGAALRHAGRKLRQQTARTKLLLLLTDGKPCDQGYETANGYAQHDVRRACQENLQHGIHTFCVATTANSAADLEMMFPRQRYVALEDVSRLPAVLARLYVDLTR